MTKSGQWKITTLDLIHYLIVDNLCTVWINSTKSSTDSYAVYISYSFIDYIGTCIYYNLCRV